jgi:hypothetical protein
MSTVAVPRSVAFVRATVTFLSLVAATQRVFAQAPPAASWPDWWRVLTEQCLPLLNPFDTRAKAVASGLTVLSVGVLVIHWLRLLQARLAALCVSVDVAGKPIEGASVSWSDAAGATSRTLSKGYAALHGVNDPDSGLRGTLIVSWQETGAAQRLAFEVVDRDSAWRWRRRLCGGRNIIRAISLSNLVTDVTVSKNAEERLVVSWKRPVVPEYEDQITDRVLRALKFIAKQSAVTFQYEVTVTYRPAQAVVDATTKKTQANFDERPSLAFDDIPYDSVRSSPVVRAVIGGHGAESRQ